MLLITFLPWNGSDQIVDHSGVTDSCLYRQIGQTPLLGLSPLRGDHGCGIVKVGGTHRNAAGMRQYRQLVVAGG